MSAFLDGEGVDWIISETSVKDKAIFGNIENKLLWEWMVKCTWMNPP